MPTTHFDTEQVIYIGGSGRSGTTLTAQLLGCAPQMASLFEAPPLVTMLKYWRSGANTATNQLIDTLEQETEFCLDSASEYNWRLTKAEAIDLLDRFITRLEQTNDMAFSIRSWAAELHSMQLIRSKGAHRIVHKTPVLASFLPEIFTLWPQASFIHLIRHPVDVVVSYMQQDFGPTSIEEAIPWYCERVGAAIAYGETLERYMEVRFEDLCNEPATLQRILNFANVKVAANDLLKEIPIKSSMARRHKETLSPLDAQHIYEAVVQNIPKISMLYSN